jgi:hypothetical protein
MVIEQAEVLSGMEAAPDWDFDGVTSMPVSMVG